MCNNRFEVYNHRVGMYDDDDYWPDTDSFSFSGFRSVGEEKAKESRDKALTEAKECARLLSLKTEDKIIVEEWYCGGPCDVEIYYQKGIEIPQWPKRPIKSYPLRTVRARYYREAQQKKKLLATLEGIMDNPENAQEEARLAVSRTLLEDKGHVILSKKEHDKLVGERGMALDNVKSYTKMLETIRDNFDILPEIKDEFLGELSHYLEDEDG